MTRSLPFILGAEATVSCRMLIYAESLDQAWEFLDDHKDALSETLAGIQNQADIVHLVRAADGFEVLGSESLMPGAIRVDTDDDYNPLREMFQRDEEDD